ncbi:MAG: rhomboid family intramembrane serine protease [Pseudorhodoplanes sp.]|uniref:rhomboid family intramembrane serine protease n=1 Tax=Pseudorhodoplanes sp. TaxID=1934341 RepID=UPI003D0C6A2E
MHNVIPHSILPDAPDSFCSYLARQFVAKQGYSIGLVAEAAPLAENCDISLMHHDGYSLNLVCLIDREANPGKTFGLTAEAVSDIGKACLQHTGRIHRAKMPVKIQIMEVGPEDATARERLKPMRPSSIFSKVQPSGWIVDPSNHTIWNNSLFGSWTPPAGFIRKLMTRPRETGLVAPVAPAVAHVAPGFPYLTTGIIAVLCAIFAAEIGFGVDPWAGFLQPSIETLLAFGGIYRPLVMQGEWLRLFSGPLLHADVLHLLLNCAALYISGRILEGVVGRAWLAATFVIGAISGALFSLAFNPENLVSVGASGAVMALFATLLVLAFHFPKGADRTALLMNSIYVLVASMVPVTSSGGKVDIAAHAGGALGGVVMGGLLLAIWRQDEAHPRFARFGGAIGIAGLAAFIFAFTALPQNYREGVMRASIVPESETPKNAAEWRSRAIDLMKKYPRDPRPRYFRAVDLIEAKDMPAAERELRAGLAEFDLWRKVINPEFAMHMQVALAVVLAPDRLPEAQAVAKPTCAWAKGATRELLDDNKLCE